MSFFEELKRRHVIRVGVAYAAVAWVMAEVGAYATDTFGAPQWALQLFTVFLILGFPVVIIGAWAFQLTPEGLQRDRGAGRKDKPSGPADGAIQSLAVLPLIDLSEGSTQAYFADGMTDSLITNLARHPDLRVISRTSVMSYKGSDKSLREISEELNVDALIEGSVLRDGDRIRVSLKLLRANDEKCLWQERSDRKLANVLELQDEITANVEKSLHLALEKHDPGARAKRPLDPEVFLLNLKGLHRWNERTEEAIIDASKLFKQAIEIDPTFAPAYVGLADCYCMLGNFGYQSPAETAPPALAAVNRALALDPDSAGAHRALGLIRWQFEFDWPKADEEYRIARTIEPNSALSNYWHAVCLAAGGKFDESHVLLEKARAADPLSLMVPAFEGWVYAFARQYDKAISCYRRVLALDPEHFVTLWFLGESLVECGEFDEGIQALQKSLELSGGISRLHGYLGYAYGRAGREDDALAELQTLKEQAAERYVPLYFEAMVHSGLRDETATLDTLEKSRQVDSVVRDLRIAPQWDWLRDHPRFIELLATFRFLPD